MAVRALMDSIERAGKQLCDDPARRGARVFLERLAATGTGRYAAAAEKALARARARSQDPSAD